MSNLQDILENPHELRINIVGRKGKLCVSFEHGWHHVLENNHRRVVNHDSTSSDGIKEMSRDVKQRTFSLRQSMIYVRPALRLWVIQKWFTHVFGFLRPLRVLLIPFSILSLPVLAESLICLAHKFNRG